MCLPGGGSDFAATPTSWCAPAVPGLVKRGRRGRSAPILPTELRHRLHPRRLLRRETLYRRDSGELCVVDNETLSIGRATTISADMVSYGSMAPAQTHRLPEAIASTATRARSLAHFPYWGPRFGGWCRLPPSTGHRYGCGSSARYCARSSRISSTESPPSAALFRSCDDRATLMSASPRLLLAVTTPPAGVGASTFSYTLSADARDGHSGRLREPPEDLDEPGCAPPSAMTSATPVARSGFRTCILDADLWQVHPGLVDPYRRVKPDLLVAADSPQPG